MTTLNDFYKWIMILKYEYGDFDLNDVKVDVRINDSKKYVECDLQGFKEVFQVGGDVE